MPGYKHPCRYCGKYVPEDANLCPFCGRKGPVGEFRCRKCGSPVEKEWKVCSHCGLKLEVQCPSCKKQTFYAEICLECGADLPAPMAEPPKK